MTILNSASDGLYPELIVLARAVAQAGPTAQDELISLCSPGTGSRLRGALSRWTALGLFVESDELMCLAKGLVRKRGESLDDWIERLPSHCRSLAFERSKCSPLWG